jgi:hypothetical protein
MQVLRPSSRFYPLPSHYRSDYDDMDSLSFRSYDTTPDQRARRMSLNSSGSSSSAGHSATLGRSYSKATSLSPPSRQRTSNQHHRQSSYSSQSGIRAESLLAYASQQDSQLTASPSMASSQSSFPPSAYMMPTSTSSYAPQDGLYASAGTARQQPSSSYLFGPPSYGLPSSQPSYYGSAPSTTFPYENLGSMTGSGSVYQSHTDTNAADRWPSTRAAPPHLPSVPPMSQNSFALPAGSALANPDSMRVLAPRPKPQCFDHGCNGRQFSTFSNLLRHQREKSGSASKAICPHCGTEFTRTTARNGHVSGGKCKGRDGSGEAEMDGPEVHERDD